MTPRIRAIPAACCAVLAATLACSSPTASCDGATGIGGRWSYQATQETPVRATVSGSIVIASAGCADFQGVMDVVETMATGESRRIAGPVSGSVVDGALVHFEVALSGGNRDHLARLAGDSLTGSWVESSGSAAGSGSFGGRRLPEE